MRKAIVTLCVGEPYKSLFDDYALPSWKEYARRHGYDLHVLEDLLDRSERGLTRPPHWQKLAALSDPGFARYDRLVWIDSDIVANPALAPDICEGCPPERIGVVSDLSQPSWAESRSIAHVMPTAAELGTIYRLGVTDQLEEARRDRFLKSPAPEFQTAALRQARFVREMAARNIACPSPLLFNSGVLVSNPRQHAAFFRHVYDAYENIFQPLNDNIPLIIEMNRQDLVHSIDSRFNVLYGLELFEHYPFLLFATREADALLRLATATIFMRSFFLHFAASYSYMPFLTAKPAHWLDLLSMGLPPRLLYPNRMVPAHRFLRFSHADPRMEIDPQPVPAERNYFGRYRAETEANGEEGSGWLAFPFDERLPAIGFHDVERDSSGFVVRWTGRASYCCFELNADLPAAAGFRLMIKYEGGQGIGAASRIFVNGVHCEGARFRNAAEFPGHVPGEENFLIDGRLPPGVTAPYVFRIRHPYLTSVREKGSMDTRQLGLALTRLIVHTRHADQPAGLAHAVAG